jgi:hypothetical protein
MLSIEEMRKKEAAAKLRVHLDSLTPISYEELEATIKKWILVSDPGIIRFLCGVVGTNKLNRAPVWTIIIGPSRGGKTEFLSGLTYLEDIFEVSTLTPNTFLSGMPGPNDVSLLPQVDGKILLFKDWTSILSMQKDDRGLIMGQLREIWDGKYKKIFGNGKIRDWEGKVGLLAASTQAVDMTQQMHTTLGERFINYRILMPPRKEVALKALQNNKNQELMRREIREAFYRYFKGIDFTKNVPDISELNINELINLADFATKARSGVFRDLNFKKEVIFVPTPEMPTGLVQALESIAVSLAIQAGGKLLPGDMNLIYKTALDSIPQTNKIVIIEMARRDERTTAEIATALGYPTAPIRLYLENLSMLGICKRVKGKESDEGGTADRWTMNPEYVAIIRKYEKISPLEREWSEEELAKAEAEIKKEEEEIVPDNIFDTLNTED